MFDEDFAYFLGLLCGDGYVSDSGVIEIKGSELEFFKVYYSNLVKKLFNIKPKTIVENKFMNGKKYSYYRSYFYSKDVIHLLNYLGIQSPKTYSIEVPEIIKESNKGIKAKFLRGIFDTDGAISIKKNKSIINYPSIRLSCRSEKLIDNVKLLLFSMEFNAKKSVWMDKGKPMYCVRLYGFKEFYKYMNLIGFSHPQKLIKANKLLKDGILRTGR